MADSVTYMTGIQEPIEGAELEQGTATHRQSENCEMDAEEDGDRNG